MHNPRTSVSESLPPLYMLLVLGSQSYDCYVICIFDDDVGAMSGTVVMCIQTVQQGTLWNVSDGPDYFCLAVYKPDWSCMGILTIPENGFLNSPVTPTKATQIKSNQTQPIKTKQSKRCSKLHLQKVVSLIKHLGTLCHCCWHFAKLAPAMLGIVFTRQEPFRLKLNRSTKSRMQKATSDRVLF